MNFMYSAVRNLLLIQQSRACDLKQSPLSFRAHVMTISVSPQNSAILHIDDDLQMAFGMERNIEHSFESPYNWVVSAHYNVPLDQHQSNGPSNHIEVEELEQ